MHTTFKLDGCHILEIGSDVPRDSYNPNSVGLQLTKRPLPMPDPTCPADGTAFVVAPEEAIFAVSLTPSHARAIASALLSAATESKG